MRNASSPLTPNDLDRLWGTGEWHGELRALLGKRLQRPAQQKTIEPTIQQLTQAAADFAAAHPAAPLASTKLRTPEPTEQNLLGAIEMSAKARIQLDQHIAAYANAVALPPDLQDAIISEALKLLLQLQTALRALNTTRTSSSILLALSLAGDDLEHAILNAPVIFKPWGDAAVRRVLRTRHAASTDGPRKNFRRSSVHRHRARKTLGLCCRLSAGRARAGIRKPRALSCAGS